MKEKRVIALILAVIIIFGVVGTSIPAFASGNQANGIEGLGGYTIKVINMGYDGRIRFEYSDIVNGDEVLHIKEIGDTSEITFENMPKGMIIIKSEISEDSWRQEGQMQVNVPMYGRSHKVNVNPNGGESYELQVEVIGDDEDSSGDIESAIGKGDYTVTFEGLSNVFGMDLKSKAFGDNPVPANGIIEYENVGEGEHDWEIEYVESGTVLVNDSQIGKTTTVELGMATMLITVNKAGVEPEPPVEDGIKVFVDEVPVIFPDIQPEISGTDLLTPVRFVMEDLGVVVNWDKVERKAVMDRGDIRIEMKPNESKMLVNGKEYPTSSKIVLKGNRLLIPSEDIIQAFNDVFYESEGNFIANYTTVGGEPVNYSGKPKLVGIPERTDYSTEGLTILDKEGVQEEAIFGETGDGGGVGGQDNAIIIDTEILTTIISFSISDGAKAIINVNATNPEDMVVAPTIHLKSNTRAKLNFSAKNISGDFFENANKEDYDWAKATKAISMKYIAFALNIENEDGWDNIENKAIYAKTLEDAKIEDPSAYIKFGSIPSMGEATLNVLIHNGPAIEEAIITQYNFTYRVEFTD